MRCIFPHVLVVLLAATAATATEQTPCEATPPLVFPIRNVSLGNGVVVRGVPLMVGTPPKNLAFDVSRFHNHTVLLSTATDCNSPNSEKCIATAGGIFNSSSSSTYEPDAGVKNSSALLEPITGLSKYSWGRDSLSSDGTPNLTFREFPLAVLSDGVPYHHLLGLGQNSTFFDALAAQKKIGSRTWGFSYGWVGDTADTQVDGSLVLGGYDSAKVGSDRAIVKNLPQYPEGRCGSGMILSLSDILMSGSDGGSVSIMGGPQGDSMDVCLETSFPVISLPPQVWDAFQENAGGNSSFVPATKGPSTVAKSQGIYDGGMLGLASKAYTGNLTFVFSPNITITIPSHQFVRRDWNFNDDGQPYEVNSSTRVYRLMKLEGGNTGDMPILGQPFFTGAYLQVSEEASTFRISPNQIGAKENITAVCASATSKKGPETGPGTGPGTAVPKPESLGPNKSPTGRNRRRLSVPGIAAGSVAAVLLIVVVIYIYRRRLYRRSEPGTHTAEPHVDWWKAEMADEGVPRPPAELGANEWPPVAGRAPPQELPDSGLPEMGSGLGNRNELAAYTTTRAMGGRAELPATNLTRHFGSKSIS